MTIINVIFSLMKAGVNRHNSFWSELKDLHSYAGVEGSIGQAKKKSWLHTFNTWDHTHSRDKILERSQKCTDI